ncbi:MAG: 30S ribosomal protein S20 [Calditrichaeota bacterium]|nr:30S ribosomal protein S20 [Calditrichota bacterium]
MPQHKSCEKRMRTSARQRSRNRAYLAKMKSAVRKVREAGSHEEAVKALHEANTVLDTVAGKGIIHRNRAADKKSRLARHVKSLAS